MRKIVNPFIVTGKIDPAYFCDREEDIGPFDPVVG